MASISSHVKIVKTLFFSFSFVVRFPRHLPSAPPPVVALILLTSSILLPSLHRPYYRGTMSDIEVNTYHHLSSASLDISDTMEHYILYFLLRSTVYPPSSPFLPLLPTEAQPHTYILKEEPWLVFLLFLMVDGRY